ncbi:hypothetical protein PoB_004949000, partial [Plakobranchus ocellatus]
MPGRKWRGSNPGQRDPCRSQGGLAIHCATDIPDKIFESMFSKIIKRTEEKVRTEQGENE